MRVLHHPAMILLPLLLSTGCKQDTCNQLCIDVANDLDQCLDEWPVGWEEEGARTRASWRQTCQNQWADLRSRLEPRELGDALEQCEETSLELDRMARRGTSCDELRALYLEP
jgi:hypothetical protein